MTAPLMDAEAVRAALGLRDLREAREVIRANGGFRVSRLVLRADMLPTDDERADRLVLDALPLRRRAGVTQQALADATGLPRQRVGEALTRLTRRVRTTGRGCAGSPYLYTRR